MGIHVIKSSNHFTPVMRPLTTKIPSRSTKVGSLITEQGLNSGCSRARIPDATETLFTRHKTGRTENQADLCSLGQSHSVLVARVHAVLLGQFTFGFRVL